MADDRPRLSPARAAAFAAADRAYTFGPGFFLSYLARFVRDRCPDSSEHLPTVQLLLGDGETLDLCHVIGVSEHWALLAVRDAGEHATAMAVDIVPFQLIRRVCIRTRRAEPGAVGFGHGHVPEIIAAEGAETLLDAVTGSKHHCATED